MLDTLRLTLIAVAIALLSGCASGPPLTELEKKEREWNRDSMEDLVEREVSACRMRGGFYIINADFGNKRGRCISSGQFDRFRRGQMW